MTTIRSIRIRDRHGIVTPSIGLMKVGARARLLFGVLLALVPGSNELNVLNHCVGRDFMTALEAGDVWSVSADSRRITA